MSKELFVRAEEVAGVLGISKPYAYKLVREMNEELKQKGFLTIPGRVSRNYFEEKFYGASRPSGRRWSGNGHSCNSRPPTWT